MFCMNCGYKLPDGAKFCMNCGTPQGAVSPSVNTGLGTVNIDGTHSFVPAMCPNCNAHMKVDSSYKIARCETCGTECLVQDAINTLSVKGNVQVGNATINVNGTNIDSLLQRVEIMLKDGDFGGATSKCNTILDSEPTNGKVYFLMLMANLMCKKRDDLASLKEPFTDNKFYLKVMEYGGPELKNELQGYINAINSRNYEKMKNLNPGDEFYFGSKKASPLCWKVLRVRERAVFIINDGDSTGWKPYHEPGGEITWADCTLRKWLNSEFITDFFTPAEQARILPCQQNVDINPEYNTRGGIPTIDKVFLLSIYEANLFSHLLTNEYGCQWWLRSPGSNLRAAAYVHGGPMIRVVTSGYSVGCPGYNDDHKKGIRPALWLNLEDYFEHKAPPLIFK